MKKNILQKVTEVFAPSEAEIKALKAKHSTLNLVSVQMGSTEYQFLFKNPDRLALTAAMEEGANPIDSAHTVAINSLVWGDEKLLDDAAIFTAVSSHINEMMKATASTLKKI